VHSPRKILYYVSGHGYGHAGRSAQVLRTLVERYPFVKVVVRTSAPAWLFKGVAPSALGVQETVTDVGMVELDARRIDVNASIAKLIGFFQGYGARLEQELRFVRSQGFDLIVADAPFIAGDVSYITGIPAVAISNFLWDWIYADPMFAKGDIRRQIELMTLAYSRFNLYLRLPFHPETQSIPVVKDMPIVCGVKTLSRRQLADILCVDFSMWRAVVLFTYRSTLASAVIRRVLAENQDVLFLWAAPLPDREKITAENFRLIEDGGLVSFQDLVAISSVVVAKLGYGTLASCAIEGAKLVFADRFGYVEDGPLIDGAMRYCQGIHMSNNDFESGAWRRYLETGHGDCAGRVRKEPHGAIACAQELVKFL
jgi:hypothetical protein